MLRLTSVRKSFGKVVAVDGLSLHAKEGEVLGLLGPNGAGKTTTISMAIGLLAPDSGTVEFHHGGKLHGSPTDPAVRSLVGVAPQALALYDELSGRENVEFFGKLYGLRGADLKRRADEAIEKVGLSDRQRDSTAAYSGGMKRRLNVAVALVHNPAMLILDEPTAGVDPQSRHAILELVRSLKSAGHTIVYSTHYMEEAEKVCDRIAIIDHGRMLALDTLAGLLATHGGSTVVKVVRSGHEERTDTTEPIAVLSRAL
ncbi:MAG: ABC transporter ATP-binding protein, partial [Mycobacteriaceae bacterium]|nr:ABC transporter ATP-binding protein [Mycobacteriaceae bacterium]